MSTTVLMFSLIQRIHKAFGMRDIGPWLGGWRHGATGVCGFERRGAQAVGVDRGRPRKHVERARIVLASADRYSAQRGAPSIGVSRPPGWRGVKRPSAKGGDGCVRDQD